MTTGFFSTPGVQNSTNGLFRPANSSTSFGLTQGQAPFGTFGIGRSFAESGANDGAFGSTSGGFTPFLTPDQFASSFGGQAQQNNLAPQVNFRGFDDGFGDGGGDGQGGATDQTGTAESPDFGSFAGSVVDALGMATGFGTVGMLGNVASQAATGKTINAHIADLLGFGSDDVDIGPTSPAHDVGLDDFGNDDTGNGGGGNGPEGGGAVGADSTGSGSDDTGVGGGDTGPGGDGDGDCVIATHAVAAGSFTRRDKASAVVWCRRHLHDNIIGEAFRRGYRWHGNRAIERGEADQHYDEFRRFVTFVTGKDRTLRGAWIVAKRAVQFTLTGLFVRG